MKQNENVLKVLADFVPANEFVCYTCGSSCDRQRNA